MYCWGNATHNELAVEQSSETVFTPKLSKWSEDKHISCVAAGESHCMFLTDAGTLYSCGGNEDGQLGRGTDDSDSSPEPVDAFRGCALSAIACGFKHSMALDEWGQPFSWGSDSMGQLGSNLGVQVQSRPKIIKTLATKHIIQISCGEYHSLALTNNGELYSWGANNYGQLGIGTISDKECLPKQVCSLMGIPIALIVCGHNHTFALSKSGAVFGWGRNNKGQLGLQDVENRQFPTQVKMLRNVKVCHIACGEDFTAFLTLDGGVWTCGSGEFGQTGHGVSKDEWVPRKIMELMGSQVLQVVCGRSHLLSTVGRRVLACGSFNKGQLGLESPKACLLPSPIKFNTDDEPLPEVYQNKPFRIFAGGDHSFIAFAEEKASTDFRSFEHTKQIVTFSMPKLAACEMFKEKDIVNQDLMAYLETLFSSLSCLNGSFLSGNSDHYGCNTKIHGLDLAKFEDAFNRLSKIENTSIKDLIFNYITQHIIKTIPCSPPDIEVLRIFLILPFYHEMRNPRRFVELQAPFAEKFLTLQPLPYKVVRSWWEAQSTEYFECLVDIFKSVVVYEVMKPNKKLVFTYSLIQILNILSALNKFNYTNVKKPKIKPEFFYIEDLCNYVDINMDYVTWLSDNNMQNPYLCNYPFLFDVQCKSSLLKLDQHLQMQIAISRITPQILQRLVFDPTYEYHRDQFLNLSVNRETIVRDTMTQISMHSTSELKKPLRVEFIGEEAEDAGGVKKEFFLLLLRELFDPVYGMFKECEETKTLWFSMNPFEDDLMYYLIGAIFGLAIYNSIIIYVPFPPVLYKKLLGESIVLDDLSDLYPTVTNGLKDLLQYPEDDVQDVFCLCFAVNTEIFDQVQVNPLKEDGENILVTSENKKEYVDLYLDFMLNKGVEKQFDSFNQGFQKVCGGRIIKLFRSYELMSVVIGNEEYDWEILRSNAEYKNGYTSTDLQIIWFWEVFNEMSLEDKKKFLLFLTGSDRVPVTGMKDIRIYIQPVADNRYFPVAHTCFNLLDLPRYSTKERLKYHLLLAIQQTQGFSLV